MVLTDAKISARIDPVLLPVAARFAAEESERQGRELDGADVVNQIRNRLVHPKAAQEGVYRLDGLVAEVWLLARALSDSPLDRVPRPVPRPSEDHRLGR